VTTATKVVLKPLEDRIVVQPLEAEQVTASGLVIPDTAKEKPQEGKVLAVGPGRVDDSGKRVPVDVSVGDVVLYSKYGGYRSEVLGRAVPGALGPRRARDHREVDPAPVRAPGGPRLKGRRGPVGVKPGPSTAPDPTVG